MQLTRNLDDEGGSPSTKRAARGALMGRFELEAGNSEELGPGDVVAAARVEELAAPALGPRRPPHAPPLAPHGGAGLTSAPAAC